MNRDGDLPSAMHPLPRQTNSRPLSAADAERLLARGGAHPEAPAVQHALADLLDSAAGPPSNKELAGEAAAVAGFMLVNRGRDARGARGRLRFRALAWRGRTVAAGVAIIVAFSGAAAANALPAPIQEFAHRTFDAPSPRHAVPPPKPPASSSGHGHGDPSTKASPSRSAQSDHDEAKAAEKKSSKPAAEPAHERAKSHTVPPGHLPPLRRWSRSGS